MKNATTTLRADEYEMMNEFKKFARVDAPWSDRLAEWVLRWTEREAWLALPGRDGLPCEDFVDFLRHRHAISSDDLRRAQNAWQKLLESARARGGA